MVCSQCTSEGPFHIAATTITKVYDTGTDEHDGDFEWQDDAYCRCDNCGTVGTVIDFTLSSKDTENRAEEQSVIMAVMSGGLLQGIYSNSLNLVGIPVLKVDHDYEGADEEEITVFTGQDGKHFQAVTGIEYIEQTSEIDIHKAFNTAHGASPANPEPAMMSLEMICETVQCLWGAHCDHRFESEAVDIFECLNGDQKVRAAFGSEDILRPLREGYEVAQANGYNGRYQDFANFFYSTCLAISKSEEQIILTPDWRKLCMLKGSMAA